MTTRKVARGDVLSLNCFPMIAGYYHALERTLFFGHVPDEALRPWEVNCEVHRRGIGLIRPGARCMDIARELNAIYAGHGQLDRRTFGYGHSFGTLCHYYGREAGLEFREDVETVLVPGMVVSMEPMITVPEGSPGAGGYREHDMAHRHRGRGREPDRLSVRAGAQRGRRLTDSRRRQGERRTKATARSRRGRSLDPCPRGVWTHRAAVIATVEPSLRLPGIAGILPA